MSDKSPVITTQSDIAVLKEKGFSLDKVVGEGSYAKVLKSTQISETKTTIWACKVIDTTQAPRDYINKFLPRELDILIRVDHPHVVQVSSIFQRRAKYFIFLRFAEQGDLLDFLMKNGAIGESQSKFWMRQILSGIHYLHTLNIAHRDLKCENILITGNYNVKITDFGFARSVRQHDHDIMSDTYCGSLSYAPPEVLKGIPYLPKLADMWSTGVILYTMLNKALPFNETSVKRMYEKQVMRKWRFRSSVVNDVSTQCKDLVTALMEPDAQNRPTALAVINGPWIGTDQKLAKFTFLEESLLKQAQENAAKKDSEDETEMERIADIRRKGRGAGGKEGLKVLKCTDNANILKSAQLFEPQS